MGRERIPGLWGCPAHHSRFQGWKHTTAHVTRGGTAFPARGSAGPPPSPPSLTSSMQEHLDVGSLSVAGVCLSARGRAGRPGLPPAANTTASNYSLVAHAAQLTGVSQHAARAPVHSCFAQVQTRLSLFKIAKSLVLELMVI